MICHGFPAEHVLVARRLVGFFLRISPLEAAANDPPGTPINCCARHLVHFLQRSQALYRMVCKLPDKWLLHRETPEVPES
jgi:hypothetical protein